MSIIISYNLSFYHIIIKTISYNISINILPFYQLYHIISITIYNSMQSFCILYTISIVYSLINIQYFIIILHILTFCRQNIEYSIKTNEYYNRIIIQIASTMFRGQLYYTRKNGCKGR